MRSLRTYVLSFVPLVLGFPLLPQQTLTNVTDSDPLALLPAPQRDPQAATAQQPGAAHQLTLIGQNDSEFSSLIATNFPGLDQLNGYATYRPFLVLLRNDTPHAIRAYMLRWEARSLDGTPFRLQDLIDRNDPGLASGRVALAPGEMRLVSDHFDVSPKQFQSTRQHNWVATMLSTVQTKDRYLSVDQNSITASVDAAVFDDDTCAGPDHYRVCARFQSELDAERDLAEEILRLLDAKASEADLLAFLKGETESASVANASFNGSALDYKFFRGRHAQLLLTLHHRGGIEDVVQRAWSITQHPRKHLSMLGSEKPS